MGKSTESDNDDIEREGGSRRPAEPGLISVAWNQLCSMRFAVFVLIIFAIASLLGALLPQQGMSGPSSEAGIEKLYKDKYGSSLGALMLRASMHDLYTSRWYLALVVLLCLCTFACACRSMKRAQRRARVPAADTTDRDVGRMRRSREATSAMRPGKALDRSIAAVRKLGYAVQETRGDDGSGSLVGRKFRWTAWASPCLHFSLLLIVLGGVVGLLPDMGFRDRIRLMEGETYDGSAPAPVPEHEHVHEAEVEIERAQFDFALTLRSFDMTYYEDGAVKEYESDVSVTRGGEQIAEQHVRVNRPLRFDGINFYQSSWDLGAVVVSVMAPSGEEEFLQFPLQPTQDNMGRRAWFVPMDSLEDALEEVTATGWVLFCHGFWHDYAIMRGHEVVRSGEAEPGETVVNYTAMPQNPALQLYLYREFEPGGGNNTAESLGLLTTGEGTTFEGYTFSLAKSLRVGETVTPLAQEGIRKVSIFEVRKDPGVPLLYAGFIGLTLAMMVALYLTPRTLRLHTRREKGTTHAVVGSTGSPTSFEREYAAIAEAIEASSPETEVDDEPVPAKAGKRKP